MKRPPLLSFLLCFSISSYALGAPVPASHPKTPSAPSVPLTASSFPAPKLVIALLVDQLRYDYLERFHDQFAPDGFRLMTERGTFLTAAYYNYAPTVTAPGHASFLSGTTPSFHGIIGNEWFHKATQRPMYCCQDESAQGVGTISSAGKMSPRHFNGSTLADEMRLRFRSKVVGISMKDRGAIFPAGKKPTGAYWFESASGNFITSTYYRDALPEWVSQFNQAERPRAFLGKPWDRLLEISQYPWQDNAPGEGTSPNGKQPVFPHVIESSSKSTFENVIASPFGNEVLLEFAKAAIEGEQLGGSEKPDLLTVSLSSLDYIGHRYGPYSQEIQDATLRLDRQLAEFFRYLDAKIGLQRVLLLLTADHGVAPTPEFAQQEGLDGQRVDELALMGELLQRISERFGENNLLLQRKIGDGQLYFNHDALRQKQIPVSQLCETIQDWALGTGKFQAAYSREQLLYARLPGQLGELIQNGYHPERSGDMVLVLKPYALLSASPSGTNHGSPYGYDTHVPILLRSPLLRVGRYAEPFPITDLVPTLATALRMQAPPGAFGKTHSQLLSELKLRP